jgi:magnesium transporter
MKQGRKQRTYRKNNPQSVEFYGKQYLENPEMQLFTYDETEYSETQEFDPSSGMASLPGGKVSWLNLHGIHEAGLVSRICTAIGMPNFIIQDILDTSQRTRIQDLGDYLFLSIKSILPSNELSYDTEQISFIMGRNLLISFQEKKGDHFGHVRVRIRENNGLVRKRGADFLLFLLLQGVMDNYFTTISRMEENMNYVAGLVHATDPDPSMILEIEEQKGRLLKLRKNIASLKDGLSGIEKGMSELVKSEQYKFYTDLKDDCLNLLESIDMMELRLDSAENLFFSIQGFRMNQVMKTLTIIATIFIPLTFIAGIYGMNFQNMPELQWGWGYFGVMILMLLLTAAMLYYFRRKRWF